MKKETIIGRRRLVVRPHNDGKRGETSCCLDLPYSPPSLMKNFRGATDRRRREASSNVLLFSHSLSLSLLFHTAFSFSRRSLLMNKHAEKHRKRRKKGKKKESIKKKRMESPLYTLFFSFWRGKRAEMGGENEMSILIHPICMRRRGRDNGLGTGRRKGEGLEKNTVFFLLCPGARKKYLPSLNGQYMHSFIRQSYPGSAQLKRI